MPIRNPILPGFHPDPSICRVGDDFYVVNSSFEWFPGLPVHHSRDLQNWNLIGHILTSRLLLDLRGVPDSAGVWAPSLSYADGQFWLIYTNIHNTGMGRPFKDIRIYLTTATNILGPWNDPIKLDSIGFDPSLFHDEDGKKYLVNIEWDFRKNRYRFAGIVLQQYDPQAKRLIGPRVKIFQKDHILTEGPNLYKRNGWYYLMLAEGGTGWNHGISAARSHNLLGPYEQDPCPSVMTTRDHPEWWLQKAGHGELVETADGEWFLAHLGSRPIGDRRCVLGRETCLQHVVWREDWLRLESNDVLPAQEAKAPLGIHPQPWPAQKTRDDFDASVLNPAWSSLRVPADETWASLTARVGWLRLIGRDSLHSIFEQSLVAQRLQSFSATATTLMQYKPNHFTQMAGLVCYYDTRTHFYLRVTHHETLGIVLGITLTDDGCYDELEVIAVNEWTEYHLRAEINYTSLQFYASPDGIAWQPVGTIFDTTKLSDDYGTGLHFTGAMIGICAQDLGGCHTYADFDYFSLCQTP